MASPMRTGLLAGYLFEFGQAAYVHDRRQAAVRDDEAHPPAGLFESL